MPSDLERRKYRARAVVDDLLERFRSWGGVWDAMQAEPSLEKRISVGSLRKYHSGDLNCPREKLEAMEAFELKHRSHGVAVRSSRGMDSLLAMAPPEAVRLGAGEVVASEMARSIRRGGDWEVLRPLAKGPHSYQSPLVAHEQFAKFREVVRAILEIDPTKDAERGVAAFVAMRIATSLWHLGNADDQALVRKAFNASERHLGSLQRRRRLVLSEAHSMLPATLVEQDLLNAQHYCLADDEILHDFYSSTLRGSNKAARAEGVDHHCVACALFSRCQDSSRPTHLQSNDWRMTLDVVQAEPFRRVCAQTADPKTAFYANAIAGATWAREQDFVRARPYLTAAMNLKDAADTPSFVAFALYWWVVANRDSTSAKPALRHARALLGQGARNLCVTPLPKLNADIVVLLQELEDDRPVFRLRILPGA